MSEKHFIKVEDGEEVSTVHHEADSDKWIFFCHGFGSDKEGSYERRAERAVKEEYNAVRFDFRGNGESDGEFIDQTLSSRIDDLKAVVEHFQPENYVLFGSSFGGKVVLHGSLELEPYAVIGRAPVTYNQIMEKYRSVVEEKGEFTHHGNKAIDERFYEDFDQYSFDDVAQRLDKPLSIFHGGSDTTVHFRNSADAIKELETDTLLMKFDGENHSFSGRAEDRMRDAMFDWLERV
ncbi:MAG: alpha/beta hydrolase family protein [Candidatus Nanohaloarchaea archaeon]